MIGLMVLALGCTAFAMLMLHAASRRVRLAVLIIGAPVGYYVIFQMPAGGADNPLPAIVGGWCLAGALGAALLELFSLLRGFRVTRHD